jgi:hypothetical protein
MVRAKFRCTNVSKSASNYGGQPGTVESNVVTLQPVCDDHNKTWSKWTPCGDIKMTINNPEAFDKFVPGECYFVDFTPAPAKEADEPRDGCPVHQA